MQTDDLFAPLMQLSQALVPRIVLAHAKTMNGFAKIIKTSSCRINRVQRSIASISGQLRGDSSNGPRLGAEHRCGAARTEDAGPLLAQAV
jgi:hypothetical protein